MVASATTVGSLSERFRDLQVDEFRQQTRVRVARNLLMDLLTFLQQGCGFDFLVDITCVDYLNYRGATDRFGLAYLLAHSDTGERLTIRVMLNEPDLSVPSVVGLWEGATGWSGKSSTCLEFALKDILICDGFCCPRNLPPTPFAKTILSRAAASGTTFPCSRETRPDYPTRLLP